jgi:Holliday junction resolvase-like predicted endonuclease
MIQFKIIEEKPEKSEKRIQEEIAIYLRSLNYSVDMITKGLYGRSGISDIIAVGNSRIVFIEVKKPGKHPTLLQSLFLEEKRNAGAIAFVAHSVEEVKERIY